MADGQDDGVALVGVCVGGQRGAAGFACVVQGGAGFAGLLLGGR